MMLDQFRFIQKSLSLMKPLQAENPNKEKKSKSQGTKKYPYYS